MKNKRLACLYIKLNNQDIVKIENSKIKQKLAEIQDKFYENVVKKIKILERTIEKWVRKTKD